MITKYFEITKNEDTIQQNLREREYGIPQQQHTPHAHILISTPIKGTQAPWRNI